ncbi:hypothetical protein B0H13DRAFT_1884603 [Mycena leptocephala]|nr:hypothetical protein B0H13DRAFT_1884603 [Mycena leptocephala]
MFKINFRRLVLDRYIALAVYLGRCNQRTDVNLLYDYGADPNIEGGKYALPVNPSIVKLHLNAVLTSPSTGFTPSPYLRVRRGAVNGWRPYGGGYGWPVTRNRPLRLSQNSCPGASLFRIAGALLLTWLSDNLSHTKF